jgi:hypothetical protein
VKNKLTCDTCGTPADTVYFRSPPSRDNPDPPADCERCAGRSREDARARLSKEMEEQCLQLSVA